MAAKSKSREPLQQKPKPSNDAEENPPTRLPVVRAAGND